MTLVPFPTSLVAEFFRHDGERTAALVYNGTFIFIAICFNLLVAYGRRGRSPARSRRPIERPCTRSSTRIVMDRACMSSAFSLAFWSVAASLALNLGARHLLRSARQAGMR